MASSRAWVTGGPIAVLGLSMPTASSSVRLSAAGHGRKLGAQRSTSFTQDAVAGSSLLRIVTFRNAWHFKRLATHVGVTALPVTLGTARAECNILGKAHYRRSKHKREWDLADGRSICKVVEGTKNSRLSSVIKAAMVAIGASTVIGWSSMNMQAAFALEKAGPAMVFQNTCSGCHAGGGNILQPGATLFSKDLERNGLATVDDVFGITYSGKGRMPGYGEKCAPRGQCTFGPRISDDDIRALAEFVKVQADRGWLKLEPS